MKFNIIAIFALSLALCAISGCGFDKYPPKTDDAAKEYIKPVGEVPTQEERDIVKAAKAEYDAATSGQ